MKNQLYKITRIEMREDEVTTDGNDMDCVIIVVTGENYHGVEVEYVCEFSDPKFPNIVEGAMILAPFFLRKLMAVADVREGILFKKAEVFIEMLKVIFILSDDVEFINC